MVLRVQNPNSSPQAFCQVGGQNQSPIGWQNRYSYGTTGMTVGVGNMIMGSKAFMVKFSKSNDGARRVAPEACLGRGAWSKAKFNMYCIGFYTDNLMKPHGSIWVVRM
jgi:hypothetical protein